MSSNFGFKKTPKVVYEILLDNFRKNYFSEFVSSQVLFRYTSILKDFNLEKFYAVIAQLVERFHGKEKVPGSNPGVGSTKNKS